MELESAEREESTVWVTEDQRSVECTSVGEACSDDQVDDPQWGLAAVEAGAGVEWQLHAPL